MKRIVPIVLLAIAVASCGGVNSWDPAAAPSSDYEGCSPQEVICEAQHGCCPEYTTCEGEPASVGKRAGWCEEIGESSVAARSGDGGTRERKRTPMRGLGSR